MGGIQHLRAQLQHLRDAEHGYYLSAQYATRGNEDRTHQATAPRQ